MRISLLLLSAAAMAAAQPGSLELPTLGFGYDAASKTIRPIRGIPGAAVLGAPVDVAIPFDRVAISPSQDYALVGSKDDCCWRLLELATGRVVNELGTAAVMPGASTVAFSPTGASAVLNGADEIEVISGLPEAPRVRQVDAPAGGPWAAAAVSDDGDVVLLASGLEGSNSFWVLLKGASWRIPVPGAATVMAFRAGSQDAIAVTRAGEVFFIESAGARVRPALAADERAADALGVEAARDGRAYAATRSGMLVVFDFSAASIAAASCGCAPSTLAPLNSEGMFRITEFSPGPPVLFDGRGAFPRAWFVPADELGRSRGKDQ